MLNFSDIKIGKVVIFNDRPCVVTKSELRQQPRLAAVKNVMLKDLITGHNYPKNFSASESIEEGNLQKMKASFMYAKVDEYSFMIDETFETVEITKDMLGGKEVYLKEGLEVDVMYFNELPISVELPVKVSYLVTEAMEVASGNSVSNILKEVTIENGTQVKVPPFIKTGDKVIINTEKDEYVERDTSK